MIDSTPTASGAADRGTARRSEPVVQVDADCQAEEPLQDALAQTGQAAPPVALQGEQVPAGPEDRFDTVADGREVRVKAGHVLARRAHHGHAEAGSPGGEGASGVALVGHEHLATESGPLQELDHHLTLIAPRIGERERSGGTVGSGQEVQTPSPEPARVGAQ